VASPLMLQLLTGAIADRMNFKGYAAFICLHTK
jgi:ammonia channel protein AmtB